MFLSDFFDVFCPNLNTVSLRDEFVCPFSPGICHALTMTTTWLRASRLRHWVTEGRAGLSGLRLPQADDFPWCMRVPPWIVIGAIQYENPGNPCKNWRDGHWVLIALSWTSLSHCDSFILISCPWAARLCSAANCPETYRKRSPIISETRFVLTAKCCQHADSSQYQ